MSDSAAQPHPSIRNVLQTVSDSLAGVLPAKQPGVRPSEKVLVVFDASGSTRSAFGTSTIRDHEWVNVVRHLSEEYQGIPQISVRLFGKNVTETITLPVRWDGDQAQIIFPRHLMERGFDDSATETALGLVGAEKYDVVICATDGNTNSSDRSLESISASMKEAGAKFIVIVVTAQTIDLLNLSEGQIMRLPGLELLGKMGCISKTIITCTNHTHVVAQQTVEGSGTKHLLMNIPFPKSIPHGILFEKILTSLENVPFDKTEAFEFLTGIFMLLAPFDRSALQTPSASTKMLIKRLQRLFPEKTHAEIQDLAIFAIESRLGLGLVAGAAQAYAGRLKATQKQIYAKVSQKLISNGLIGDKDDAIVLPTSGIMILAGRSRFNKPYEKFLNSMDETNNIGCALLEPERQNDFEASQEFRQGFRVVLKKEGFPAADSCTEAILATPLMMQMMLLTGVTQYHESVRILRMLAQTQWKMTITSLTDKDVSFIIWDILMTGDMPQKKEGTLMDLFAPKGLIPFVPPINWALLMACLGPEVYQAQKKHFEPTLSVLNIKADDASEFIDWFVTTFGPYVKGRIPFVDARVPQCSISGEPLIGTVMQALPHGDCTSKECITIQAHQSLSQFRELGANFCPYCRSRDATWVQIVLPDKEAAVVQAIKEMERFVINLDGVTLPCMTGPGKTGHWNWKGLCVGEPPVVSLIANAGGGGAAAVAPSPVSRHTPSSGSSRKKVISVHGPTNPDKQRALDTLEHQLMTTCYVIPLSLRKKRAEGLTVKAFNGYAQQTVGQAKKRAEYEGKVFIVILDLDDDKELDDSLYGIRWSDYTHKKFTPNFWVDETTVSAFIQANGIA
jgi:hypothetical protein